MLFDLHSDRKSGRRSGRRSTLARGVVALLPTLALCVAPALAADKDITAQVQQAQKAAPIALPSLAPLAQRVLPAVVNISAELGSETAQPADRSADEGDQSGAPFDELLRRFFENRGVPQSRAVTALGSGFIIDRTGYIVTNNHVVGNASKVTAILQDNTHRPAKIIGRDEKTDLALIKIDSDGKLPFVTWGDSDQAKVGDWIVAVGNPFGLGGTVTAGIVSALGRNINEGPYDDFIQIDAPINKGNSGGPTFDLSGEVIGVNTAIYSPSGGSVGIGFAVPSNTANSVIAQLKEKGHVTRGWLGVSIQGLTPAIAKSFGLNPQQPEGALVAGVTPNSPAAKAGLKQGDVILKTAGQPIKQVHDMPRIVANTPVGQKLDLAVRRDGKDITVAATVAEMPEKEQQVATAEPDVAPEATGLGIRLAALNPELRHQLHITKEVEGVVVAKVASDSPAASLGLEPGDVIMSIDQRPATTPQQAAAELQRATAKGTVLLLLNRHGTTQFVGLSVTPGVGSSKPD